MDYRSLGTTGMQVSPLCLGAMMFGAWGEPDHDESVRIIHRALDEGVNFIDTADVYSQGESEEIVGKALAGGRRDDVILATKFHGPMDVAMMSGEQGDPNTKGNSRRWMIREVESSLRRLQTDWIDLYQLHTPDPETPIATTIDALDELVEAGKIRAYGHSNLSGEQIREAAAVESPNGFVTAQDEYSLLARGVEADVLPAAREAKLGFLPYFPLYNGLLSGKYTRTEQPHDGRLTKIKPQLLEGVDWTQLEEYDRIARDAGLTMLEATFAWLLAQDPVVSVIAGATKPEQIAQNVAAGEARMSADVVAAIDDLFS
jgi:1-deoxyxylulose-5-phosphate synthase